MEEKRENYEHFLTLCENLNFDFCPASKKLRGKSLSDVEKNVCKFVIKSDWSGLKISMFLYSLQDQNGSFK